MEQLPTYLRSLSGDKKPIINKTFDGNYRAHLVFNNGEPFTFDFMIKNKKCKYSKKIEMASNIINENINLPLNQKYRIITNVGDKGQRRFIAIEMIEPTWFQTLIGHRPSINILFCGTVLFDGFKDVYHIQSMETLRIYSDIHHIEKINNKINGYHKYWPIL